MHSSEDARCQVTLSLANAKMVLGEVVTARSPHTKGTFSPLQLVSNLCVILYHCETILLPNNLLPKDFSLHWLSNLNIIYIGAGIVIFKIYHFLYLLFSLSLSLSLSLSFSHCLSFCLFFFLKHLYWITEDFFVVHSNVLWSFTIIGICCLFLTFKFSKVIQVEKHSVWFLSHFDMAPLVPEHFLAF